MVTPSRKQLVVVLGMHRSGTSALARALRVVGVELGDRLMPAVAGENDKGFWEDLDVNELNVEILRRLGGDWDSFHLPSDSVFEREDMAPLRARAAELLRGKTAGCEAYGIKDPRLSLLLPFWQPIFRELEFRVAYLLAVRNPISVERSLRRRNDFAQEKSYRLWMEYTLRSLSRTRGESRLCVDFDELILDPSRHLWRIARLLDRQVNQSEAGEYVARFLESELRHSRHFAEDLAGEAGVSAAVWELYWLLLGAAIDDRPLTWTSIDKHVDKGVREMEAMTTCALSRALTPICTTRVD